MQIKYMFTRMVSYVVSYVQCSLIFIYNNIYKIKMFKIIVMNNND